MMKNGIDSAHHAHDSFYWLKQARELDTAAMLIWSAIRQDLLTMSQSGVGSMVDQKKVPYANLGGVFWLNAGFALENLFKGLIVQSDPQSVVNGTITAPLKTHDLGRLAKRAGLDLAAFDAFFLGVATQCIQWAGRYPCSTKSGEFPPPVFSESDVNVYRKLFDEAASRFTAKDSKTVTFMRLA
jgi:hypothetical protein